MTDILVLSLNGPLLSSLFPMAKSRFQQLLPSETQLGEKAVEKPYGGLV